MSSSCLFFLSLYVGSSQFLFHLIFCPFTRTPPTFRMCHMIAAGGRTVLSSCHKLFLQEKGKTLATSHGAKSGSRFVKCCSLFLLVYDLRRPLTGRNHKRQSASVYGLEVGLFQLWCSYNKGIIGCLLMLWTQLIRQLLTCCSIWRQSSGEK